LTSITRIISVSACLLILSACDSAPRELTLVTPSSPSDRAIVEDLRELFASERVLTRVRLTDESLSGEDALNALAAGEADIALVSNSFESRRDIATVMPLYPTVLHIARRAGAETTSANDGLRGTTVYAGKEGSASRLLFDRFVKRTGLSEDDYRFVDDHYRYVEDHGELPDVVVVFAPISTERVADFPDELVLTSFGTPADIGAGGIIDSAVLLNPHFRPFVIPVGTYGKFTPEPIVTIAVDKILVARSDLPRSVVYDLINDILRLRPALAAKRPGLFQGLSEDFDASRSRFILHSGTQAYLQRSAPTYLERYSGVAEVAVTLLVALFSASLAGIRIFKMRRKNRIDRFYAAAIEIRNSAANSEDPMVRNQAIAQIRELQNEAFDQLVHEKLAANESFRIFITLSNDVLRQLGASDASASMSDA
jgi:TRAP-type uncharacterized transport system substrate-binding protein